MWIRRRLHTIEVFSKQFPHNLQFPQICVYSHYWEATVWETTLQLCYERTKESASVETFFCHRCIDRDSDDQSTKLVDWFWRRPWMSSDGLNSSSDDSRAQNTKKESRSNVFICSYFTGEKRLFLCLFKKKVFMYNKPKHFSLGQHGGGFYFLRHQHQSRKMKQINKMSKGCDLDNSTNWSDRVCFLFILFFFIYETHVNQQHWWDVPTLASWSGQCPPSARCCKADQVEDLLMQSWAW